MAILAIVEQISERTLFFRTLIFDQLSSPYNVYLRDGTRFSVHVEKCGIWSICGV